jgi:Bardet-Biedl syndrome 2 protein
LENVRRAHAPRADFQFTALRAILAVDGTHFSLVCATTGGRVFIHNPHESNAPPGATGNAVSSVRFLNINREVTALAAGPLSPHLARDILLIGTSNSMQAYDVQDNRVLFFREVPDAVTAAAFGTFGGSGLLGIPLAFAGGNCSIQASGQDATVLWGVRVIPSLIVTIFHLALSQGFDAEGKDAYWTVTGDVVTAMAFGDVDGDGKPEIIAGA